MRHATSPERYEQTLEDYERLLSRPYDEGLDKYRAENHPYPLSRDESRLEPARIAMLEELGFLPTARTHSIMKDGSTVDSETWVDESGATTVELDISPDRHAASHSVSTSFADGTAITVWPSDSIIANQPTPNRTNIRGVDDLRTDIATGITARDERLATGVRPLLIVDVRTARLHDEFHARFLHADPVKVAMANIDTSDLWKFNVRLSLSLLGLALLFALAYTVIFGRSDTVLIICGLLALMFLGQAFRAWWGRDEPREPFPGMANEDAEQLVRELLEREQQKH